MNLEELEQEFSTRRRGRRKELTALGIGIVLLLAILGVALWAWFRR